MANGKVKWFNAKKGYGFIVPQDNSGDVFVHITAVQQAGLDRLPDGTEVSYDLSTSKGKTSAVNLRVID